MDTILKNIIRVGNVTAINAAGHQVRVAFGDNAVSYWLDVIVRNTYKNKDYAMPDLGEQVVCIFLPNGNSQGYILGAVYSTEDMPPVNDIDKRHVTFEDGTEIEYDRNEHALKIIISGSGCINISAPGSVSVAGDVVADGISLKNHIHTANGQPPEGGA
jgi:phage baseplate assembly protein V